MAKTTKPNAPNWEDPRATARRKLDAAGIEHICEQIIAEKTMTAVAEEIGVSIGSLIVWIEADPERSARAREARRFTARLCDERAMQALEQAEDPFNLAKAREKAQHWRWRASKIAPREYGEKMAIGGAEDLPPIQQTFSLKGFSAEELATMEALARKAAGGEGEEK